MTGEDVGKVLTRLQATLESRRDGDPNQSYVAQLYKRGEDAILKKVGEEATEVIIAAKGPDDTALVREMADLWFHSMVLLVARGLRLESVTGELARREGRSGLDEKAARGKQPSDSDGEE